MSDSVTLNIDGKSIIAQSGERLIDVAQREGAYIPRFCYHPKLSVVASCRMCLVDIEGIGKTQPACATLVHDGMVVRTTSAKAINAQKIIMQFLLINHPLNCPICDQGGECELQDTAMGYGPGVSQFTEDKRVIEDENLGPLIETDMSLCIHCTRCVRFGKEIAGVDDLGLMGRGDSAYISTYLNRGLKSEVSGNMIDLCPVGALTSKPFKFKGRSWGFKQHFGVSPHDCVGSNLYYHTIAKGYDHLSDVMRILPSYNEEINEGWLSDRDRFGYEGINANERLTKPMIKVDGQWQDAGWEEVLTVISQELMGMDQMSREKMGVWLSTQMTTEEAYLCQSVFRQLGIHNIDHRLLENCSNQDKMLRPYKDVSPESIPEFEQIVLLGSNIRYEQPILALQVKKAADLGKRICSIGAVQYDFVFPCEHSMVPTQALALEIHNILNLPEYKKHDLLQKKTLFVLGEEVLNHPQADVIKAMIHSYCNGSDSSYVLLPLGANALGVTAAGGVPHIGEWGIGKYHGMGYQEMLKQNLTTVWLHNIDPQFDVSDYDTSRVLLKNARVIAATSFDTPTLREVSDIMLPISVTAETPGSYINYMGLLQKFSASTRPKGDAKMGWSLYHVLGSLLSLNIPKTFDQLQDRVDSGYNGMKWPSISCMIKKPEMIDEEWMQLGLTRWTQVDMQIRHAQALSQAYPVDYANYSSVPVPAGFKIDDSKHSAHVAKGVILYERGIRQGASQSVLREPGDES